MPLKGRIITGVGSTSALSLVELYLQEKTIKIRPDDQPWANNEIKSKDRRMKREFRKKKKSAKWHNLEEQFRAKCEKAKHSYSKNIVNDLKHSNPSQWYSKIK